ncbi:MULTISPECIES: glycoside hydrolase family 19 protein [unclassified Paraflavitalea]|uniref:glycoside hydrolase family 19 protein n=1 Tax=unclassified Paraflavitalea TaxID=2798305 RepID=UPI003D334A13
MAQITREQLKAIVPTIKDRNLVIADFINKWAPAYQITTKADLAAFVAQCAHESAGFNVFEEMASGDAYDTRTDLGNTPQVDGDGRKYKGRGAIQTTGTINYRAVSIHLFGDDRLLRTPELLATDLELGIRAAMFYWKDRGLSAIANKPDNYAKLWKGKLRDKFEWLTIRINGGVNGLAERRAYYSRALKFII